MHVEKGRAMADDLIGTLAIQAVKRGFSGRILTGDRDLLQLVQKRITVSIPKRGVSACDL